MKKLIIIFVIFINQVMFSQAAIGALNPDPYAQLDVSSSDKGILIPRITLIALDKADPIAISSKEIPESLLVFNRGNADVPSGYFYWQNKQWNKLIVASDSVTDPTTNVLVSEGENTIQSIVNGVAASTEAVKTVSNTVGQPNAIGYPLTTTVNGINSTVDIPQPWNVEKRDTKATDNAQNIYQQGRVGIGVANMTPEALLDVRGDALINGLTVGKGAGNRIENTAVGSETLRFNTAGYRNTAVGHRGLFNNIRGLDNTAVGYEALIYNTTSDNTAVGLAALKENRTGTSNTAVGKNALLNNTTGSYNTAIGYNAGSEGNFENTTSVGYNARATRNNMIRLGNSSVQRIEGQAQYMATSDRRYKENIQTIPLGLDFINKVRPVEYIRKNNEEQTKEWGFIAQELQQVITDTGYEGAGVVQYDNIPDKYLSVSYTQLIAPVIKAIQELSKENIDLKRQNDLMEQRLTKLEERIKKIMQ